MKPFLALLLCCSCSAVAAEWQSMLSSPEPGEFPAMRSMRTKYSFGWTTFTAGSGVFDFTHAGGQQRLRAKAGTSGFVRSLWKLDATHSAVSRADTMRPVTVEQTEIYKRETKKIRLVFDPEGVTRTIETNAEPGSGKPKRFKLPKAFDLHTALLWVRSQKLAVGEQYRLVVYAGTAAYLAHIDVVGAQRIKAAGRGYPAKKLELKLWRFGKEMQLDPHKKFKRLFAWISDDSDRLFLKAQGEIFVGSVWAELSSVQFAAP